MSDENSPDLKDRQTDAVKDTEPVEVLLADDHTIVRQGIETLLEGQENMKIVSEASDGYETVTQAEESCPDLAIVDISMPRLNGLEAVRRIKEQQLECKVILLSMYDDEEYIRKAISVGAEGYVLKEGAINELVEAINQVMSGQYYLSPPIIESLVQLVRKGLQHAGQSMYDRLTSREREVLQLIAEGHSNKEIADILSRSVETVRTHRANLMDKLDLHSAAEVTQYAIDQGIIKEDDL